MHDYCGWPRKNDFINAALKNLTQRHGSGLDVICQGEIPRSKCLCRLIQLYDQVLVSLESLNEIPCNWWSEYENRNERT